MTNLLNKKKQQKTLSYDKSVDNDTFKQDMEELNEKAMASLNSPGQRGFHSVSGSTPDPESDDDVLQNAHQMGLAPDADLEHPQELNIAKNIDDAEKFRRKGKGSNYENDKKSGSNI